MSAKNGKEAEEENKLMKESNSDTEERKRGGEAKKSAADDRPSDGIVDDEEMNISADATDAQELNLNDQSKLLSEGLSKHDL